MRGLTTLGLAILLAAAALADTRGSSFRWNGRLPVGKTVEVRGFLGDVRAEFSPGGDVEVFAMRRGARPERVKIDVLDRDGGITVAAVYPAPQWKEDVKVDFVVRVPAGVRLIAHTTNGRVSAAGLASDVEAHTLNGGIEIETSKSAQADTVNGSIVASVGEVRPGGARSFSSVNGSVVLDLPPLLDALLDIETLNGTIRSEFPGRVPKGARRLHSRVGKGGHVLSVRTSNGNVWLLRTV